MSFRATPTALASVSLLLASLTASAATLRVPQDYSLIQRAAWAAAPGDTIAIAEGTFFENVVVTKSVTIQGAGAGKTIIAAKDRAEAVLAIDANGGASAVQNLTLRHEPEPQLPSPPVNSEEPPVEHAANGLTAYDGEITVKNVAIEKPSGTGAAFNEAKITVEHLSIASAQSAGLSLYKIAEGSSVNGLTVSETAAGYDLTASDIVVEFKNLKLDGKGTGFIQITGAKTAAKFPDLPAALKEKISWEDGASPDGQPKEEKKTGEKTEGEEGNTPLEGESMDPYSEHRQGQRDEHQRLSEPARRVLARELQAALKDKSDAASYAAALGTYFKGLMETYQPGETADFGVDRAISGEMRVFYERFGATALADAIAQWPKYSELHEQLRYDFLFTPIMKIEVEAARGAAWVKANASKLDEIFAQWKNEKSPDPAKRAAAFLACIEPTAALLYSDEFSPDALRDSLRKRLLEELNLFIAEAGYPALNQLLRRFAGEQTNDLISPPELQAALTAEQKRELFKAMRGGR
jgi:hypothetical protein